MSNLVKFNFHGSELDVVKDGDDVWVSVVRCCELLGVDERTQQRKLAAQPWASTVIMTPEAKNKVVREMYMLHLDSLPMWLATITATKVSKDLRPKLVDFQIHCASVLRDHFFGAPQSVKALDLTAANGPRIGDTVRERHEVGTWLVAAAKMQGVTLQRLHGFMRKTYKASSIYNLSLDVFDHVRDTLQAMVRRELLLPGKPARLRLISSKQPPLPGVN